MTDLVLANPKLSEGDLFERVATAYLRLQDESHGKRVRISAALDATLEKYPGFYDRDVAMLRLGSQEFADYLAARRKESLIRNAAATYYAAEIGEKMGELSAREMLRRLSDDEARENISNKDLTAMVKLSFELAQRYEKQVQEITGTTNVQVNMDFRNMIASLPPDKAMDYMAEIVRRAKTGELGR